MRTLDMILRDNVAGNIYAYPILEEGRLLAEGIGYRMDCFEDERRGGYSVGYGRGVGVEAMRWDET